MILGHKSQIFLGKETTWGSVQTPTATTDSTAWWDYELYARPGSRPRKTASTIISPFMTGNAALSSGSIFRGRTQVTGGYSLYLSTHGMQNLIYLATGDPSVSGDGDGDTEETAEVIATTKVLSTGVDHTLPSCSILHAFGKNTDADFEGSLFNGMMLNQMSINCAGEDSLAEMTVDFLGKDETWIQNLETYTDDTLEQSHKPGEYYVGWKARLYVGATGSDTNQTTWSALSFFDFSMSYNNNLRFPDFIRNDTLPEKPEVADLRDISGSFTLPFIGNSDYATGGILKEMFEATPKALRMDFNRYDSVTTGASGQSVPTEYFRLVFPNVVFLGDGSPASIDHGLVKIPVNFRAASVLAAGVPKSEVYFQMSH